VTVFLVLGVLGLVLLLVSLVLGDLFDGVLDALPSEVFSSAVIGGFVSAFGFGAALSDGLGATTGLAVVVGVVVGVAFAWFAGWLTRLVRGSGSDATVTTEDTVGRDAKVVTGIPEGGFGVVRVQVGGHSLQLNARADAPVTIGTEVYVTAVLSPTAVAVAPVHPELA
jgi:membrane protein implicated in regulation of membrane protease activity